MTPPFTVDAGSASAPLVPSAAPVPNDPIAIVGMSCRLPGGIQTPGDLWDALIQGRDLISDVPPDRFDAQRFVQPGGKRPGKTYTASGGFLDTIAEFDAAFFGISPREATQIDPQQRLMLELAVEALDDAGIDPATLSGSDTAVYAGVSNRDYGDLQYANPDTINAYTNAGNAVSVVSNRVSYVFNLRGPSLTVDTACSSALVALHQACQGLRTGESRLALVAGVNLLVSPYPFVGFAQASMLSPRGRSHAFADGADGYVRAEGGALVVLKPLSEALAAGDRIHAVIRATGVNSDGHTVGLSLPNGEAQEVLLRQVYARSGVLPEDLVYFEAHGTGTAQGDPIECGAIGRALGVRRPHGTPLPVGSIKTNVGHLESGSGVAGLLKAVLVLAHGQIPPSLHGQPHNPAIDFPALNLRPVPEPLPVAITPRSAVGVNSFGFGGTNAHAVITAPPALQTSATPPASPTALPSVLPIVVSARSEAALAEMARRYATAVEAASPEDLYHLAYTATVRRGRHAHRFAAAGATACGLAARLRALAEGVTLPGASAGSPVPRGKVAFAFSGNGSQWAGMASTLLDTDPTFRATIEAVDAHLVPLAGWSVADELRVSPETSRLALTEVAQPALFAVQLGLVAILRARGIEPRAVFGHSVGEVAAAYVSGALDLVAAVRVIVERSRAQALTAGQGRMAAVGLSPEDAGAAVAPYAGRLELAAVNSPTDVTISGDEDALASLSQDLAPRGTFFRRLDLNYAFHSQKMDPIEEPLRAGLGHVPTYPATIPFISTVTGQTLDGTALTADYWWRNIRQPVEFAPAVHHLLAQGFDVFVEIGPHAVLDTYLRRLTASSTAGTAVTPATTGTSETGETAGTVAGTGAGAPARHTTTGAAVVVPTLRRNGDAAADLDTTLARLIACDAPIRWEALFPLPGRVVDLPPYAWQRERHWNGTPDSWVRVAGGAAAPDHPLLGARLPTVEPTWHGPVEFPQLPWLVDHKIGEAVVMPGAAYMEMGLAAGALALEGPAEVLALDILKALTVQEQMPPEVQLSFSPEDGAFKIASRSGPASDWQLHARGILRSLLAPQPAPIALEDVRPRLDQHVTRTEHYAYLDSLDLRLGPSFRVLESIDIGAAEGLAPYAIEAHTTGYQVMPALLDGGLQTLTPLAHRHAPGGLFLPAGVRRIRIWRTPPTTGFIYGRLLEATQRSMEFDVSILDETGAVCLTLEGCAVRRFDVAKQSGTASRLHHTLRAAPRTDTLSVQPAPTTLSPETLAADLAAHLPALEERWRTPQHYADYLPRVDALCAHVVARAIARLVPPDQPFTAPDLLAAGVSLRHARLLDSLLQIAAADGFIVPTSPVAPAPPLVEPTSSAPDAGSDTVPMAGPWRLVGHGEPEALVADMVRDFPEYGAELVLLARCGAHLDGVLRGEVNPLELIFPEQSMATAEHLYDSAPFARFYNALAQAALQRIVAAWPAGAPLRVLEIGGGTGGMTASLLPHLPPERTQYVYTDVSEAFLSRAATRFQRYDFVEYRRFDVERDLGEQGILESSFDLVVAANVLHATTDLRRTLHHAGRLVAPGGFLLALEKHDQRWLTLVFGLLDGWWLFEDASLRRSSPLLSAERWPEVLGKAGFDQVSVLNDARDGIPSQDSLLLARRPVSPAAPAARAPLAGDQRPYDEAIPLVQESLAPGAPLAGDPRSLWIVAAEHGADPALVTSLTAALAGAGCIAVRTYPAATDALEAAPSAETAGADDPDAAPIVFEDPDEWRALVEAAAEAPSAVRVAFVLGRVAPEDEHGATLRRAAALRALSRALTTLPHELPLGLSLIARPSGVFPSPDAPLAPVDAAVWGLTRSLANEVPRLNVRRLSVSTSADTGAESVLVAHRLVTQPQEAQPLVARLAAELLSPTEEDEVVLTPTGRFVPRLTPLSAAASSDGAGPFRLEVEDQGPSYRLVWREHPAPSPAPGEVAINTKAVGLNYHDVLWAMGILGKEAAAGGFFGEDLGIDCAGVVTAVGPGVTHVAPGDRVFAFARASFASHTVSPAGLVARMPADMTFAEAATLPAVFLTVHYSLFHLARLKPGETLLVHGAAGGVGLAALQYAHATGARVIATAGSEEKRTFLRLMGVEHVLDSRSLRFAHEVMELTGGEGVDVVLNSLAGEAIPRGLDVLRPFGRFLELGKRDFFANSRVGLRPFRNNVSFFGVDVDALLLQQPALSATIFDELTARIADSTYRPLLHRAYPGHRVEEAFRLMQGSRHVGKVVVTLEDPVPVELRPAPLRLDPAGTYLVAGGLDGFGAAAARWLASHGARRLALAGRRGAATPGANTLVQELAALGVTATPYAADVTRLEDVRRLVSQIDATGAPLRGVIHAAMVLDDAALVELTRERFDAALAPKLLGGLHLDRVTRDRSLDLFVVFSSVTAAVGNPGQSNYAAGNLFLEALVRRRRREGLPGLAVAWGAIDRVGYLARNTALGEAVAGRLGVGPLDPDQALNVMGELLAAGAAHPFAPEVVCVGRYDWGRMRQSLSGLASPRFGALMPAGSAEAQPDPDALRRTLHTLPLEEALPLVEDATAQVIADILRTKPERLDRNRRLDELGMDSLMAVELEVALDKQFGCHVPVMEIIGTGGIQQLAAAIAARLRPKAAPDPGATTPTPLLVATNA